MQPVAAVLLAAGLDWIEGLLPILFVVIWLVSQVLGLFRRAAAKPAAGPVRPPVPGGRRGRADAREEPLDQEIEEFLRRTLQRDAEPGDERRPPRRLRSGGRSKQRRRQASVPTPPPLPEPAGERRQEDVAGHVAAAFADDLIHASPQSDNDQPRAVPASPATELVSALRTPGGLRQLILMREVLERPTHRW